MATITDRVARLRHPRLAVVFAAGVVLAAIAAALAVTAAAPAALAFRVGVLGYLLVLFAGAAYVALAVAAWADQR